MAIISALIRYKGQPAANSSAASSTGSEQWTLTTDENSTPIEVNRLVRELEEDNDFDYIIIGETHPQDSSLTLTDFSISQPEENNFKKYFVTTKLTNDNNSINSSVQPSQAQDTYNFSHVEYETIVTVTKADSKKATSDTGDGEKKDKSIQNTNGAGIIATEGKSILRAVITRSESDFDLKVASTHIGRVNKGSVSLVGSTFAAGKCRLVQWAGSDAYDSEGNLYWRVTYEILISDDDTFFEKEFIMRGTTDINLKPAPAALGYTADTSYKLKEDGTFFSKEDQADPAKFFSRSFATLEASSWGPAVRLSSSPNPNIVTLTGDSSFGLIQS